MDGGPDIADETTQTASPWEGRRDLWLEQRLTYLVGELARLKAGAPLRRFLRGAAAAYCRLLRTADPAQRFHCWTTIQAVGAGLDRLECGGADPEIPGSAPGGPDPGQALAAGLRDRVP